MRPPTAIRLGLALAVAASSMSCGGDDASDATAGPATFATVPAATAPSTTGATSLPSATTTSGTTTAPGGDPEVATEEVATLDQPVDLAVRSGDDSLYVVERPGTVRAIRAGAVDAEPVLDVSDLTKAEGERGLLGLAFSPDGTRGYVNYTDRRGDTVVAEYAVGGDGRFDAASARTVLTIDQPYANHNGGAVAFGPDGMLYVFTGDGGSGGDPERRSLNLAQLLGKVLRIDPTPSGAQAYTVPPDNPFLDVDGARPEIWSVGLRNPWRTSFDPDTGDLWIADVGQNAIEEIDVAWADQGGGRGQSFGWSAFEGDRRFNDDQPSEGHTAPIAVYPHGDLGCSISGGERYRGDSIAALDGWYVYGDYCSGLVQALQVRDDRTAGRTVTLLQTNSPVSAVRVGPDGELYVLRLDGPVVRLVPPG